MTIRSRHHPAIAAACILAIVFLIGTTAPDKAEEPANKTKAPDQLSNLIKNGQFDEPNKTKDGPAHWQAVDNLVYHWTKDPKAPGRGKVLRIDTSVDQRFALNWWVKRYVHHAPLKDAPAKVAGKGYSHLGGEIGGFYWSDFIPIKKGGAYKVYVDAKGPQAKVFIRGYEKKVPLFFGDENGLVRRKFRTARGESNVDKNGRPIKHIRRFRYTTWFAVGGSDKWKTYTHDKPRHPNRRELTEDVRFIRIMLYPYWPPGDYWFDNIRVVEEPSKPFP